MKKKAARKTAASRGVTASAPPQADMTNDWRGELLGRIRGMILQADPEAVEEIKWRKPSNNMQGVPVWSHAGILCTGETYKTTVKLTFAKGAALPDPESLFNSSLEGNTRRAIDFHEGDKVNKRALQDLIKAAVAENLKSAPAPAKTAQGKGSRNKQSPSQPAGAVLLSGGNPQIAKADGDAPVQAYIAALPGWKQQVGRALDALIVSTVPEVRKAVRWNTPFYGIAGQGWFLGFHCMTKYIKVAFFAGALLDPPPPVASKQKNNRYFHLYEGDKIDEQQLKSWIEQAADLPGEKMFQ